MTELAKEVITPLNLHGNELRNVGGINGGTGGDIVMGDGTLKAFPFIPKKVSDLEEAETLATLDDINTALSNKQDVIPDLNIIKAQAEAGNKAAVIIQEGIGKERLTEEVQDSLDRADTALQEHQDLTPIISLIPEQASQENQLSDKQYVSEMVADFITRSVNDLLNYYRKNETYTRAEILALLGTVKQFTYESVAVLPTASADTMHKIYLVPSADPQAQNIKDEYITIDNGDTAIERYTWECIGSTAIDLSGYVTTADLNSALSLYTTTADLMVLLATKQDKLISGTNIKTINGDSVLGPGNIKFDANTVHRELKQAEYDALSDAEKNNGTVYFIKDAGGGDSVTFATGEKVSEVSITERASAGSKALMTSGGVKRAVEENQPGEISEQEIDDIIYS